MSPLPVGPRLLQAGALALLGVFSVWAGLRVHEYLAARGSSAGVRVPAGLASAPTPSDRIAELGGVGMPSKIPERLPDFALADTSGHDTSIHTWDGRSLIVNFWATWCEPCRREIPLLKTLAAQWSSRGMTVIGIAVDERPQVVNFARELKIDYPLLVGEQDALDVAARLGFDSPGFPFTVFTDRRGEVVALYLGELHPAEAKLILEEVQAVNQDREPVAQARRSISEGLRALRRPS
ncbi:MAG TPA: TlpA disulfide reductase family protein [Steroidobacteraceae bacterium]|nr:TlpA disulfide reductase family protein [Steroidobacteraceae bacterium]